MLTIAEQLKAIENRIFQMAENNQSITLQNKLKRFQLKLVFDQENNHTFSLIIQGEFPLDDLGLRDSSPFHPFPNALRTVLLERGKGFNDADDILFESKGIGSNKITCKNFKRLVDWIGSTEYKGIRFCPFVASLVKFHGVNL